MTLLQITQVDAHDDEALATWHDVMARAEAHDRGDHATTWTLPELTQQLRRTGRTRRYSAYVGTLDGTAVAMGLLIEPLLDNTTSADLLVDVLPDHRRQGHGTAMLHHLEATARELGRTVLHAEVDWPHDQPVTGDGRAGVELLRREGWSLGLVEVMRVLPVPVDDALLDRLATEAAAHHEGYALRSWVGAVPSDLLDRWAVLTASLTTEAPTGDLTVEPEPADVARVREGEELMAAQGRTPYRTVALDPDGVAVGYTELVTTVHEPHRAYQWGTLVHRDHRGHRLGVALKAANHRLLQEHTDLVDHAVTWNADSNSHMVSVNEEMGFRPVEWCGAFEKRL